MYQDSSQAHQLPIQGATQQERKNHSWEGLLSDSETFYQLHVTKNYVEFIPVPELICKCKDTYAVLNAMMEKYDKKVAVMSIGRGGLGAVIGSKKTKYITVNARSKSYSRLRGRDQYSQQRRAY